MLTKLDSLELYSNQIRKIIIKKRNKNWHKKGLIYINMSRVHPNRSENKLVIKIFNNNVQTVILVNNNSAKK